jgi:hypothetical protein
MFWQRANAGDQNEAFRIKTISIESHRAKADNKSINGSMTA